MKKLTVIILMFLITGSTYAQKLNFGLKFSPHFSWFKIDNKDSIKNNGIGVMFSYGLTGDFNFAENYAFNVELLHTFYNAGTIEKFGSKTILKYKLQNIEIPLTLKMKTNYINDILYFGRIGIAPSIKTQAKVNDGNTTNVTAFNVGMIIGAGLHYKLADKTAFLAGLTLHNFFLPVNKKNDVYNLKPIYISVDLGILF